MLETSKDVLNLLLAFSIVWVALWFSWILYQIGRGLKGVNDIIKNVQDIVSTIHEGVDTIKDKGSQAAAYLTVLIKTGQQILKHIQKKKSKSSSRARKSGGKK